MSRIYEPSGPRVRLRGRQSQPGFAPITAVDTSQQVRAEGRRRVEEYGKVVDLTQTQALNAQRFATEDAARVGQQMLDNAASDLGALAKFSETLGQFMLDRTKKQTEEQMRLGIADIINGDLVVSDEARQQFNDARDRLANAAADEAALSDVIAENASPLIAEQHRASSPLLRAWRAYGQALGKVKKTASQAQTVLQNFMESDLPVVVIPNEDGSERRIAPRDAKTGPEINAALAVGEQMMIRSAGLQAVNPVLIAEHLAPQVMAIRSSITANRTSQARTEAQQEAITQVSETISLMLSTLDPANDAEVQQLWQVMSQTLQIDGRMPRGDANELVIDQILGHIDAMAAADSIRSMGLLEAFAQTPLIASQPNGVTVGEHYRQKFQGLADGIENREERTRARAVKMLEEQAADISNAYRLALTQDTMNPEAQEQLYAQTVSQLEQLANLGSQTALNDLERLRNQGAAYSPFLASDLARDIAKGIRHRPEEIDELVRLNRISPQEGEQLKKSLPESRVTETTQRFRKEIDQAVRGAMTAIVGGEASERGSAAAFLEAQAADEVEEGLELWLSSHPDASPADIRDFLGREVNRILQQPRFRPENLDPESGMFLPTAPLSTSSRPLSYVDPATGREILDMRNAEPARVQTQRPSVNQSVMVSPQELSQNVQSYLSGGQPTPRVNALMAATGLGWEQFLRAQSTAYSIPFANISQSQAARAAAERARINPSAAAILNNPNATQQQRARAWNDINSARERQQFRQEAGTFSGGTTGPVNFEAAFDALVGKESGGDHTALNRSGSGATGLGQVMPENIGPWTQRWLGRRMSQEEFRRDPQAQRTVVMSQFQNNIEDQLKAGHPPELALRRAAAIWYSGRAELHMDTRPQSWNGNPYPSIKDYVDDIVRRYNSNNR